MFGGHALDDDGQTVGWITVGEHNRKVPALLPRIGAVDIHLQQRITGSAGWPTLPDALSGLHVITHPKAFTTTASIEI